MTSYVAQLLNFVENRTRSGCLATSEVQEGQVRFVGTGRMDSKTIVADMD